MGDLLGQIAQTRNGVPAITRLEVNVNTLAALRTDNLRRRERLTGIGPRAWKSEIRLHGRLGAHIDRLYSSDIDRSHRREVSPISSPVTPEVAGFESRRSRFRSPCSQGLSL